MTENQRNCNSIIKKTPWSAVRIVIFRKSKFGSSPEQNKRRPAASSIMLMRGVEGIRTPDEGFADPCLTTWPRRHFKELSGRWDSNPRPSPWQGDVLPLYYARILGRYS